MEVVKRGREVELRMRVIGMDLKSGEIEVMHAPLFGGEKALKSPGKVQEGQKASDDPRIFKVRFSGVEYPLIDRCVKELQHPQHNLFGKP